MWLKGRCNGVLLEIGVNGECAGVQGKGGEIYMVKHKQVTIFNKISQSHHRSLGCPFNILFTMVSI